ncbi:hypothetical protein KJ780_03570 [Candidatus Micrarchaeota archaeon]|nr:hypothetical protein [Candidatus Micrarchaeota archaeon]
MTDRGKIKTITGLKARTIRNAISVERIKETIDPKFMKKLNGKMVLVYQEGVYLLAMEIMKMENPREKAEHIGKVLKGKMADNQEDLETLLKFLFTQSHAIEHYPERRKPLERFVKAFLSAPEEFFEIIKTYTESGKEPQRDSEPAYGEFVRFMFEKDATGFLDLFEVDSMACAEIMRAMRNKTRTDELLNRQLLFSELREFNEGRSREFLKKNYKILVQLGDLCIYHAFALQNGNAAKVVENCGPEILKIANVVKKLDEYQRVKVFNNILYMIDRNNEIYKKFMGSAKTRDAVTNRIIEIVEKIGGEADIVFWIMFREPKHPITKKFIDLCDGKITTVEFLRGIQNEEVQTALDKGKPRKIAH